MDLLDRLRLQTPVVQAGMGGGVATADLAAAVSNAGGLGTVGWLPTRAFASELHRAREMAPGRPVAANLLMPFVRRGHADACLQAKVDVAVLFCGFDRGLVERLRSAGVLVLHQVGAVGEARRALGDGADGLVVQGVEAGGHLRGRRPLAEALAQVKAAAGDRPVLAAGGIATADGVRRVLDAGAAAAVAGTRFLLTDESAAHPLYKQRVLGAGRTLVTRLFGVGWLERHRVVPNAATERWCGPDGRERLGPLLVNTASVPMTRLLPQTLGDRLPTLQRRGMPVFTPMPPLAGMDDRVVDVTPLYAGSCAAQITSVRPAAEVVRELAG